MKLILLFLALSQQLLLFVNGDTVNGDDGFEYVLSFLNPDGTGDKDIGETAFNDLFHQSVNHILLRECTTCAADYQYIYYKRITNVDTVNLYYLTADWMSNDDEGHSNNLGTDFELYSTLADALAGTNQWDVCNYDDPGVGMFRDCGVSAIVGGQWTGSTAGHAAKFYVYLPELSAYILDETLTTCADLQTFCQDTYGTDGASIHSQMEYDLAFTLCQTAIPTGTTAVLCCLGGYYNTDTSWEWYDSSDNTLLAETTTKWSSGGLWAEGEPASGETSIVIHAQWDDPDSLHGLHGYGMSGAVYPICNSEPHPCESIDGGGWRLVRHSYNTWHQATDNLAGTDVYGTYDNDPQSTQSWSIQFDELLASDGSTEFMFSDGDCTKWLITTNDQFTTSHASEYEATILSSSYSSTTYTATWLNRQFDAITYDEDPWISVQDHATDLLYGEATNEHHHDQVLGKSINVWVRPIVCSEPSKFIWEELMESETAKPNVESDLSIVESTLTLKFVVDLDYLGASEADNNGYVYGTTYVIDFEDYNAHSDDITKPGTCQNRADVLSSAGWDDLWDYSLTPNEAGEVGSLDHLAYPPGGLWTVEMNPDAYDECGTVRYSVELTWDELTQCASYDGNTKYIAVDSSATEIILSGTLYVNVVSPFAYQSDFNFYRVYQLLSQPFQIKVSKTVYVLDKTGINLLTIDIVAVYKEAYDDKGENKFVMIVLTESAEYLQLSRAALGGALLSFDPDTETGLQTSDFAVSLTTEDNTGCLQNKDYICSQLWQIHVANAQCSKTSDKYTDFSGTYSIGFEVECRNDLVLSDDTTPDAELMGYCADWLDGADGHRAEIVDETSGLVVLDADLIWKDEICDPLVFDVQFEAFMRFFTSDAYSTESEASDTHLFMVGTDPIYVSVTTDYPSTHFTVFNTELVNVWICTFNPLESPDAIALNDRIGGCFSSNTDTGIFDGHDGHIYDKANDIKLEGFAVDTDTPESNIVEFELVVPTSITRDKLYVHAQIEVSLSVSGERRRRRVLMAVMEETNQMSHFVDKVGIRRSSPPIDNPKPVNNPEPISYPQPQQPFVISLESPWVIGIGCLLALVLTVNIVFMCYMNCNKRRMYSPVKYQDSEFDESSECAAINVASD